MMRSLADLRADCRPPTLLLVALVLLAGCDRKSDSGGDASATEPTVHDEICEDIDATIGLNDGYAVPGVAGAPRWGLSGERAGRPRVRRSWSRLDAAEKTRVVYLGPLFNFKEVLASELLDYRSLGYEYDSLPQPTADPSEAEPSAEPAADRP